MYRPVWSAAILEELEYEETEKLVKRGEDAGKAERRARNLIDKMREAFDDAEVEGWEALEGTYGLPDPDDEHVLAAAVIAGAGAIITSNVGDFPQSKLPMGIEVLQPPEFAANTVSLNPTRARAAVAAIAQRSGRMGQLLTEDQVLDRLVGTYHMARAVEIIRHPR